jgi:hypothetical protein
LSVSEAAAGGAARAAANPLRHAQWPRLALSGGGASLGEPFIAL